MDRDEWGIKRICQSCGTKFYDFGRSPIVCPACGATFDINALLRKKKSVVEDEGSEDILDEDDIITDEDLSEEDEDLGSEEDAPLDDEKR